ncbi:exostosin-like 3 [Patiria miniata]|uniref:glucuronosyl-galactosyl-proteoglycan 4-alpha-N-acetylglucosaminyltransferase n=1 Tax=Patiria miniata TaxID=46514 RepID=A0A913ZIR9_PATMI|nr:exostosin-like 3 [Patiria miniata]XP_038051689.1 exostosin-like 3 [Patiria miniata]
MDYQHRKGYNGGAAQPARATFLRWLQRNGILMQLIMLLIVVMVFIPLVTHYYLSNAELPATSRRSQPQQLSLENLQAMKPQELKARLEELYRIRSSVQQELLGLEARRKDMQNQIDEYSALIAQRQRENKESQSTLDKVNFEIVQKRKSYEEVIQRSMLHIGAPKQILPQLDDNVDVEPPQASAQCRQHNCFDYSRCSLTSHFPVYIYASEDVTLSKQPLDAFVRTSVANVMTTNPHVTFDPNIACVYLVLIGDTADHWQSASSLELETSLRKLPLWKGDGRNHVLLNLARNVSATNVLYGMNTDRAILVQSNFDAAQFRPGFDIVAPMLLGKEASFDWKETPPLVPAKRKYLLSFQGILSPYASKQSNHGHANVENVMMSRRLKDSNRTQVNSVSDFIQEELHKLKSLQVDNFYIEFKCPPLNADPASVDLSEWWICRTKDRLAILKQSTYALIIGPDEHIVSSTMLQMRLYEALKHGAIPVILGEHVELPFGEFIQWRKAAIILPKARASELYFYLKTIQDNDIVKLRGQGWFVWTTYLSSAKAVLDTILATLRTRLNIPASIMPAEQSVNLFPGGAPLKQKRAQGMMPESDDFFPPPEIPFPSPKFLRNFTYSTIDRDVNWNTAPGPFKLFPNTPFDPVLPSDAKFIGSGLGFRPIGKGSGGTGKEFQEALGGNIPGEQFTIIILTYERDALLMTSLERLMGLPYLNKVIVVWNSPKPAAADIIWPEIHVPIKVVRTKKNSLNNRFLPYDEIETEAILSLDDDAHLRHDEILFGFRVWRENRDQIVGFPGRYHAWDVNLNNGFLYNSNYSCELSMVLTGAAFIHKYYAYLYSYVMPQVIRDKVDEYMNCEDIAMNFLVSHITRKPPVKVTSRWTFRCPSCPEALSQDDSHFKERHRCIQFFNQVYGYIPLLYTQFRVDSVLFKTRVPHDKQKCFKFV